METIQVSKLYHRLIESWNKRDARLFAGQFTEDCLCIGFDGSEMHGKSEIETQLTQIFASHPTAPYVTIVREVKRIGNDVALLHAHVGMTPNDARKVDANRNAVQVMVARFHNDDGKIILFQNTPAEYHGRPEVLQALTEELQLVLDSRRTGNI